MIPARPLRIAVLIDVAPRKLGSMEAWMVGLAEEARRRGHQVAIFCGTPIHPGIHTALTAASVSIHELSALRLHPLRSARRLAREYDVIHGTFIPLNDLYAAITYAAWPARVIMVDQVSSMTAVAETRLTLRRLIVRCTTMRIAAVAAVSRFVERRESARLALSHPRIRTIYNGVDTQRFTPARVRPSRQTVEVLVIAHLIAEKGIHVLIEAVARCSASNIHLSIAGDGPERAALQALAASLHIATRTTFLGLRDDADALLRDTDIFVHPAVWQEAFGFTVAEAMATGCAVIASRVGAIPELITDGVEGLLVPPSDRNALALALAVLANDSALRERMGASAREKVVRNFSLEQCAREHVDWCEEFAPRR